MNSHKTHPPFSYRWLILGVVAGLCLHVGIAFWLCPKIPAHGIHTVLTSPLSAPTHSVMRKKTIEHNALRRLVSALAVSRSRAEQKARVRTHITQYLQEAGWRVQQMPYATGTNLVAEFDRQNDKGGSEQSKAPLWVLGAHYDHIPDCPGADDNATGVAGLLYLAHSLVPKLNEASSSIRIRLIFWDEEETGFKGSLHYLSTLSESERQAHALYINLDMIGVASEEPNTQRLPKRFWFLFPDQARFVSRNQNRANFIALFANRVADTELAAFVAASDRSGLPVLSFSAPQWLIHSSLGRFLLRSDHGPFWYAGMPALFLTDTANFRYPQYHCRSGIDAVSELNMDFMGAVLKALQVLIENKLDAASNG